MQTKTKYTRVISYSDKTLHIKFKNQNLRSCLPDKSFAPSSILPSIFSGLLTGCQSARELEKHHKNLNRQIGGRFASRATIGDLLDEDRVVEHLKNLSDKLFIVAKNMRLLKETTSSHKIVAIADGIDLGQVHKGGGKCNLCLERKVGGEIRFYHRIVVISIMSKYGPLPVFMRVCRPNEIVVDPLKASSERFKSDCELSCAKELLVEIAGRFRGRLPFDVLASDALMANAPFMELVESLGALGIFIFKQENRKLYKQAKADFTGKTLGFNVGSLTWNKDPAKRGRSFQAQWSTYIDNNRKGQNKNVKIFEITRTEKDGEHVQGMAISSDNPIITPQLVEEMRYAKWKDLENGVFNELTNIWGTLKHLFFHKENAVQSMIYLQFLAQIAYRFYCFGNLTRGGRRFTGTVRDFFHQMIITFMSSRKATLIEAHNNSP